MSKPRMSKRARCRIPALLLAMALPGLCQPDLVRAAEPRTAATKNDARDRSRGTAEENATIARLSVQYLSLLGAADYEAAYAMVAKELPEVPDFETWRAANDNPGTKRSGIAFRLPSHIRWFDVTEGPHAAGRYGAYEYITVYTTLKPTIETLWWYHDAATGRYLLTALEREELGKGSGHHYRPVAASRTGLLATPGARLRQGPEWDVMQWQNTPALWAYTRADSGRPEAMVLLVRLEESSDRLEAYFTLCNDGYLECRALNETVQKTDFDAVIAVLPDAGAPAVSERAQEGARGLDASR